MNELKLLSEETGEFAMYIKFLNHKYSPRQMNFSLNGIIELIRLVERLVEKDCITYDEWSLSIEKISIDYKKKQVRVSALVKDDL